MNLTPLDVRGVIKRYGLHLEKRLGQNFLIDPDALERIIRAADIQHDEFVLEVGSGIGNLTRLLADQAKKVITIEIDSSLIAPLQEVVKPFSNIQIIQGDVLKLDLSLIIRETDPELPKGFLVVANIPYYITSALIRHLMECTPSPDRLVLTVQKEVAERICAKPGKLNLMALSVQVYGEPRIESVIKASAFYPSPEVDSAIVRIDIYPKSLIPDSQLPFFFRLAKAGFSQKRKTIRNALSGGMAWKKSDTEKTLIACEIDPKRRAETLSLQEWQRLINITEGLQSPASGKFKH